MNGLNVNCRFENALECAGTYQERAFTIGFLGHMDVTSEKCSTPGTSWLLTRYYLTKTRGSVSIADLLDIPATQALDLFVNHFDSFDVTFYDFSSRPLFFPAIKYFLSNASLVVHVIDGSNASAIKAFKTNLAALRKLEIYRAPEALIINKIDTSLAVRFPLEQLDNLLTDYGIPENLCFFASARTGYNVIHSIDSIIQYLLDTSTNGINTSSP